MKRPPNGWKRPGSRWPGCSDVAYERRSQGKPTKAKVARGLLLYSRRTANGKYGEWLMLCPPLIVTEAEIDEIARLLALTLADYEAELRKEGVLR